MDPPGRTILVQAVNVAGVAAVHRVGGAEVHGLDESVGVEIEGDDASGTVQPGRHHCGQAHGTSPDHGYHVARLDAAVPYTNLKPGGQDI